MSVPVGQRSASKLDVQVSAEELVRHTVHIMSNPNVFDPRYAAFASRVIDCAVGIGQDLWEANGIYVGGDPRKWAVRRDLQEQACRRLDTLLYLIGVCRRLYHLRGGKYRNWSSMATKTRDLARRWRDSDARRYGHLVSGT